MDKSAVSVPRTNSHCKEEMIGHVQQNSLWLSMLLSLPHCALDIFATVNALTMEVDVNWKSLRIVIFMDLKRPLNWLKNKIKIDDWVCLFDY